MWGDIIDNNFIYSVKCRCQIDIFKTLSKKMRKLHLALHLLTDENNK